MERLYRRVAAWPGWAGLRLGLCALEDADAMLLPLGGPAREGAYVDGRRIVRRDFAICIRADARETAARAAALARLEALGAWLEALEPPDLGPGVRVLWLRRAEHPQLRALAADGMDLYEARYTLAAVEWPAGARDEEEADDGR